MIAKLLMASFLVATTVIIHAAGLGMVLSHTLHSTDRPDTRFWSITWLLIRIAWFLIVIHLLEIGIWALLMALTTLSTATGVFFVVVSRLFGNRFKLKTS